MLKALLKRLFQLLFRIEISGADAATFQNEKTLVVANHTSFLDGLLLVLFLPADATFLVHTEVTKNPMFRFFLRFIPHYAIDTTNPLGIRSAMKLVNEGQVVVIFPEGRLTKTGSLMKVYDGAAHIAAKTEATVVQVRINGAGQTYFTRLGGLFPRKLFPKLSMAVMEPTRLAMPEAATAKLRRRKAGNAMRDMLMQAQVSTRRQLTMYQAFVESMQMFGRNRLVTEDVRMVEETYGQFHRSILGLGRWVQKLTQPGEVVGHFLPAFAPAAAIFYGVTALDRVITPLNISAGADALRKVCVTTSVKHIFTSRTFLDKGKLWPVLEAIPGVTLHFLEDAKAALSLRDKLWVLYHTRFPASAEIQRDPMAPAVILATSGSEGTPKGVVHSHDSLLANVEQVRAMADFTPLDKLLVALPLFHSFGLMSGVLLPFIVGAKVFYYPSPLHFKVIPELVYNKHTTILFGTNSFLKGYGNAAQPYDMHTLRYVIAGAEKLSEEVRKLWAEKHLKVLLEGYGTTETAPVVSVNTPMGNRMGTVGRAVPGLELHFEPFQGVDSGGQLFVKGPNVMLGYMRYDNPGVLEPTGAGFKPGWHDTGDVVTLDDDGFLRIVDRAGRFWNPNGEKIALSITEELAGKISKGTHAAIKRTDKSKGEGLVFFTTDPELTREKLLRAAQETGTPEVCVPRETDIHVLPSLPLLPTGKTDFVSLKNLLAA